MLTFATIFNRNAIVSRRAGRPGLLEARLVLTSVKYHGNLHILIPLNQRLALTRLRATSLRLVRWLACLSRSQLNSLHPLRERNNVTSHKNNSSSYSQGTNLIGVGYGGYSLVMFWPGVLGTKCGLNPPDWLMKQ